MQRTHSLLAKAVASCYYRSAVGIDCSLCGLRACDKVVTVMYVYNTCMELNRKLPENSLDALMTLLSYSCTNISYLPLLCCQIMLDPSEFPTENYANSCKCARRPIVFRGALQKWTSKKLEHIFVFEMNRTVPKPQTSV